MASEPAFSRPRLPETESMRFSCTQSVPSSMKRNFLSILLPQLENDNRSKEFRTIFKWACASLGIRSLNLFIPIQNSAAASAACLEAQATNATDSSNVLGYWTGYE
jgi:hypothetical protein